MKQNVGTRTSLEKQIFRQRSCLKVADDFAKFISDGRVKRKKLALVEDLFALPASRTIIPTEILAVLPRVADGFQNAKESKQQNLAHSLVFSLRSRQEFSHCCQCFRWICVSRDSQLIYRAARRSDSPRPFLNPSNESLHVIRFQIPVNQLFRGNDFLTNGKQLYALSTKPRCTAGKECSAAPGKRIEQHPASDFVFSQEMLNQSRRERLFEFEPPINRPRFVRLKADERTRK